jgi:probable F420-dependent oxidoreductase
MRFGIQHSIGDPAWTPDVLRPAAVADFARRAEDCGFDLIAFTDHPAPSQRWVDNGGEGVADPFSSLGFVAAVTSRVRLMTFVLVAGYRNPLLAAHQIATLDALSEGRVTVGLGTGYLFSEFRALGADPANRRRLFDENVDLMRRAWAGETITAETATLSARATRVLPPVVQQPHPPLWIHGNGPFGTERAARYGDGWLGMITAGESMVQTTRTTALADLGVLRRRIEELRAATERAGRDPGQVDVVVVGAWPMLDVRRPLPTDRYLATVAELEELGVDWVLSTVCGDDVGAARDTLDAFGGDVVGMTV